MIKKRVGDLVLERVISLNWRILLLDYEIGEYVLYHELAHLKHMNHSKKYWELLSSWVGDARGGPTIILARTRTYAVSKKLRYLSFIWLEFCQVPILFFRLEIA